MFAGWGDWFSGKSGNVVRIHVFDGRLSEVTSGSSKSSIMGMGVTAVKRWTNWTFVCFAMSWGLRMERWIWSTVFDGRI